MLRRNFNELGVLKFSFGNRRLLDPDGGFVGRTPILQPENKVPSKTLEFNFSELNNTFLKEGLDALLTKLKELKAAKVIDSIKVKSDSTTGKTTVTVEVDGIEYEFTGVKGEKPTEPDLDLTPAPNPNPTPDLTPAPAPDPKPNPNPDPNPPSGGSDTIDQSKFDYSGVPNLKTELSKLSKSQVFESLSSIKEQLHKYIQQQLESKGKKYDKDIVEKELNYLMSAAYLTRINMIIKPNQPTVETILNDLANMIEQELNVNPSSLKFNNCKIRILGFETSGLTKTQDLRLIGTDDYFLSQEEIALKKLMTSETRTGHSISKIEDNINTFAQHTRKYLKAQYNLSDSQIDNIINKAKSSAKTLTQFIDKCEILGVAETLKANQSALTKASECAEKMQTKNLKYIVGDNASIHTEFGINANGDIEFENSNTKEVYQRLCTTICNQLQAEGVLNKLGGTAIISKLVQTAWLTTYNAYNSSQSNPAANFVTTVLENFEKMMNKLKTNPEYLEIFTMHTSYADDTLTEDLIHYDTRTTAGGDEKINYYGNPTTDSNGVVHLANSTDDPDYQMTMKALLINLKEKYNMVDATTITNVFRDAQKKAIEALQKGAYDCPYGTGSNNGRVEDFNKNWSGYNNRKKDKGIIDMDQLVQMTLYYFDKLLNAKLIS